MTGYVVAAAVLATVPGFFGDPGREALIMVGLTALVWISSVPSSRLVSVVAGALATSSLYIYLTHWQIYPHLYGHSAVLAMLACLVLGIAYAALMNRATAHLSKLRRRVRLRMPLRQRLDSQTEGVLN